jgi:hypothetical protein
MKILLWFSLLVCQTVAFAPAAVVQTPSSSNTRISALAQDEGIASWATKRDPDIATTSFSLSPSTLPSSFSLKVAGFSTGLLSLAGSAFAGEEIEMAELPPPWVPAVFAVVLLIGVGVLTGSLGNVMDEGTHMQL